jgi:hypothetical protein
MKAELKQKWIAALRSGEYKQGKGVLRTTEDRFCCLGVLCNLIAPDGWGETKVVETAIGNIDAQRRARKFQSAGSSSFFDVPRDLAKEVGLEPAHMDHLVGLNDSGKRFPTIAKYIEEKVKAE